MSSQPAFLSPIPLFSSSQQQSKASITTLQRFQTKPTLVLSKKIRKPSSMKLSEPDATPTKTTITKKRPSPSEISFHKKKLLDAIAPLDFGRAVLDNKDKQAEIEKIVKELEALNPTENPADHPLRKGRWRLLYTESPIVLGRNRPGFARPDQGWQVLEMEDGESEGRVLNEEEGGFKIFGIWDLKWRNAIRGRVKSLRGVRLRLKFEDFKLGKWFKVGFPGPIIGWQDQTFLDEELRIARTHYGNLFVLEKEKDV